MSILLFWSAAVSCSLRRCSAFLGVFQYPTESLVLLAEGDPDKVNGLPTRVFQVAFRDIDIAVEAREFADSEDLVLPFLFWVLDGREVLRLDLFIEGLLRDAEQVRGLCDREIDFVCHGCVMEPTAAKSPAISGYPFGLNR